MTGDLAGPYPTFRHRLRRELGLDADGQDAGASDAVEHAAEVVRTYCAAGFTGAAFDTFGTNDPDTITADDLIALTMLSIHIRERSTSSLRPTSILSMGSLADRIAEQLAKIPADRELHTLAPEEFDRWLGPGSAGYELYRLLRKEASIPRVAV